MAWMKQSGRVWMPGLGGISVSPRPLAANPASRASMTSRMDMPRLSTSALLK